MLHSKLSRRTLLHAMSAVAASRALRMDVARAETLSRHAEGTVEGWTSHSPFLTRAFAPVFDERDDVNLAVEGEIPRDLHGVFMRNGPNPAFSPDAHYAYPFDGAGMLHAIYIESGKVTYRNRWVGTAEYSKERAAGKRLFNSSFGSPPHANLSNTNIVYHAGRFLSLYEGGIPYEVNRSLSTNGPYTFDGRLKSFMSAHPKRDPVTGELIAIAYDLRASRMTYLRAGADGALNRVLDIASPWPAMVHDIAITPTYVVACLCPLVFDFSGTGPPATWQPERGTRIMVVPRDAGSVDQVRWIDCAPFFHFHTVNAFESGNIIELALPWYDAYTLMHDRPVKLELHRLTIDLAAKKVLDNKLDDMPCEFGRVNDRYLGQKAQFGYVGLRDSRPGESPQVGSFEAFARYDLKTGQKVVHRFAEGETVCEPVFVPAPGTTLEDDGYIVSFVHGEGSAGGTFVLLDARRLDAAPLARVKLPRRVPAGLHGSWIGYEAILSRGVE